MENGEASEYTLRARGPFPLGIFLQPIPDICRDPLAFGFRTPPCAQFVSTSDQGNDLKDGKWGSLDASLSFLEQTAHIVGSSNGFLLCTTNTEENMKYIICNPVTKEYLILPEAHRAYKYVAMAFICKGDGISLGGVRYEIIRAGVANPRELMRILEIETFSSETGEWKESSIISPSPFMLDVANIQALVLEDIIYWEDPRLAIVAYDPANEYVKVINLPPQTYKHWCGQISQSEGKIYYARARSDTGYVEILVLDDYHRAEWSMKHRVNARTIIKQNPGVGRTFFVRVHVGSVVHRVSLKKIVKQKPGVDVTLGTVDIDVTHMHPWNSEQILLMFYGRPFWYDLESKKLMKISVSGQRTLVPTYFLYEWPSAALPQ